MARVEHLIDPTTLDFTKRPVSEELLRRYNPQRFEMLQLDAIIHLDHAAQLVVGYKDVRDDEFWVRGHMPGYPIMPGVIMCEAAAQLSSWYVKAWLDDPDALIGLGGLEEIRFRTPVRPGDRLVVAARGIKLNRRQMTSLVQGFVGSSMAFSGKVIGIPIPGSEKVTLHSGADAATVGS